MTAEPRAARPPALRPGDRVGVVAPAGPFDVDRFERGLARLSARYEVVAGTHVYQRNRYLAGTDEQRAADLLTALRDPEVRAVFCARGGYGAMRLLPVLGSAEMTPTLLVGFSDITALHMAWYARGRPSIHGPVVTGLADAEDEVMDRLVRLLESPAPPPPLRGRSTLVGGIAEGRLVGGNLAVLAGLAGTPYLPSLRGALLLLEDVGEPPYRVDRHWTQLVFAGSLDGVAGLVLGGFTDCVQPGAGYTCEEVVADLAAAAGLPCVAGLPVGHAAVNMPVPFGARARLDADRCTLEFQEAAVRAPP